MTDRYGPVLAIIGGLLTAGAAVMSWPSAMPSINGVTLAVLGIGALIIISALGRVLERDRSVGLAIVVGGLGMLTFLIGGYGYWQFLIEEIDSLTGPLVAITAGTVVIIGAIVDVLSIGRSTAVRQVKASTLMAIIGFGGLLAMIVWANILFLVALLVTETELTDIHLIAISSLSLGLGTVTVTIVYLYASNRDRTFVDLKRPSVSDVAWTVGGIVALFAVLIVIVQFLEFLETPVPEHELVEVARDGDPNIILYVLIPASLLLIGPGEELLFRNVIQKSLYEYFSTPGAIIIASLIFAVAHFPAYGASPQTVGPMLVIFALSLLLGAIYAKTKNILVPAVIHGVYNALQFASLYVEATSGAELAYILILG